MSARTVTRIFAGAAGLALVVVAGQASFSGSATSSGPVYTVQSGDSLWRIASIDGLSVAQLAGANNLASNAGLQPGMVLAIPPASYVPGSSSSSTASASSASTASSSTVSSSTVSSASTGSSSTSSSTSASDSSGSFADAAIPPQSFCATFSSSGGPAGVLPSLLAVSPERLALRPVFVEWANYYGVSPALLEAISWQESGWQEGVVSVDQAVGVGQLIPTTAQFINDDLIGEQLDPTVASENIRMSAAFLGFLNRLEQGNLCNTIAAYYEGPQNLAADGVFTMTEPYVEDVEALLPRFE